MPKHKVKIHLHLNKRDQQELNYQVPDIVVDFEGLMHQDFVLPITGDFKDELIRAIRKDFNIPDSYLNEYQATFKEGIILVY